MNSSVLPVKNRLDIIRQDILHLDREIEELNNDQQQFEERNEYSVFVNDEEEETPFKGKYDRERLFKESIETLEKKRQTIIEQSFNSDESGFQSTSLKKNQKGNYIPISKRINEGIEKRNQFTMHYQSEKETKELQECTFKPVLNSNSIVSNYDRTHLYRPHRNNEEEIIGVSKVISEASKKMAEKIELEKGFDFQQRQFKKYRSEKPNESPRRVLTIQEQTDLNERLLRPKQCISEPRNKNDSVPKKYEMSTIERLVKDSLKSQSIPQSNKESKTITKDSGRQLYDQSLKAHENIKIIHEETKKLNEKKELEECSFKPKLFKRIINVQEVPEVKAYVNDIPKVKNINMKKRNIAIDQTQVDAVLHEVNELLL